MSSGGCALEGRVISPGRRVDGARPCDAGREVNPGTWRNWSKGTTGNERKGVTGRYAGGDQGKKSSGGKGGMVSSRHPIVLFQPGDLPFFRHYNKCARGTGLIKAIRETIRCEGNIRNLLYGPLGPRTDRELAFLSIVPVPPIMSARDGEDGLPLRASRKLVLKWSVV